MEPRMVHLLAGVPDDKLIHEVARGLTLIFEHVSQLQSSIETLCEEKQPRGVAAVRTIADEEAAKYLILVDAIRCPRKAQRQRAEQLRRCNDHLSKGIYAYIAGMSPADLGEIRRIAKGLRQSYYLDGPTDYDWIFRNSIEEQRERTLYVDYVRTDEGADWEAPDVHDDRIFLYGDPSGVVRIVQALTHAGIASVDGLRVVAEVWRNFVPEAETHWQEVAPRNRLTLEMLQERDLVGDAFTDRDAQVIVDEWTFPLHHEELSVIRVNLDELRRRQKEWVPD
jgi:hypothetical protein